MEPWLLEILCCPETRQPLREASADEVVRINEAIAAGRIMSRSGSLISEPVEGVLVREDGAWAYGIWERIPVLLVEEALPWTA